MGYPTQKPLSLLRKLIAAACPPEGIVLDPFCGCATTCIAAEQLGRQWIGIDVSIKAWELVKLRLEKDVPPDLFRGEPNFSTTAPVRSEDAIREEKYIYVISHEDIPDEYKVGIATNVNNRLNQYKTSHPNRDGWKVEYKLSTPKYREIESLAHDHFDNRHEWVRAERNDIIDFIVNHNV